MHKTTEHIPSLDGIRAVAALTVFASHCGLESLVPGGFGVTIFFFLSGYLITTLLRLEYEKYQRISLKKFYLRRFYRIIPPMYIVLGLLFVLYKESSSGNVVSGGAIAAQFAHLTNYYLIANGPLSIVPTTTVLWSLAVEEHFYVLFPFALILMLKRWSYERIGKSLLVVCAIVLAWRYVLLVHLGVSHNYTYMATDARIDSILYGCVMGVWLNPVLDVHFARVHKPVWWAILAASLALLGFSLLFRNEVFRETARYSLQGIALFPLFFCAIRFNDWPIFRWLDWKPLRAMGLISYTFYLVHVKALQLVGHYLERNSGAAWALGGFVLAVGFSAAMYWLVERRLGAVRRRLHPEGALAAAR